MLEHIDFNLVKRGLHTVQALFIFVVWALTLAIFTKPGFVGGQIAFVFALCFITVPALIYQVAVPIFPRAQRFASVYAYAIVDILFALLWFSAAVVNATWTTAGINQAKETDKDADGTCNHFAFGDASKCNVSRGSTAFAFFVWLLFIGTSTVSVIFVRRYRNTGQMPGTQMKPYHKPTTDAMDKGAWSASVEEREGGSMDEIDERRRYAQLTEDDEHGLLNSSAPYGMQHLGEPHPGSQLKFAGTAPNSVSIQHYDSHVPSALSPNGYENDHLPFRTHIASQPTRLDFSAAHYQRGS